MAEVELTTDALALGDIPAISVKSGRRCSNAVGIALRTSPVAIFTPRHTVVVALEPGRVVLRRVLVLVSYAVLTAAMVFLFLQPAIAVAGFVTYAAILALSEWLWIGMRESPTAGSVILKRVHPDFVRAATR